MRLFGCLECPTWFLPYFLCFCFWEEEALGEERRLLSWPVPSLTATSWAVEPAEAKSIQEEIQSWGRQLAMNVFKEKRNNMIVYMGQSLGHPPPPPPHHRGEGGEFFVKKPHLWHFLAKSRGKPFGGSQNQILKL